MTTLFILFIKELFRRRYPRKDIRLLCKEIKPFFEYLVEHGVHTIKDITASHVKAYAEITTQSCSIYNKEDVFITMLTADGRLCAVRMFCLQMYIAGRLPMDWSCHAPFIEFAGSFRNGKEFI